jgi:Radical SAM superfamily
MLGSHGFAHRILDANCEGILHLLKIPSPVGKAADVWTQRAFRNRERNIASLRDPALYRHLDRYKRAVRDIGRVLSNVTPSGVSVGLVKYEHQGLSPVKSGDLLTAAQKPELNPFYPYFGPRLEGLFHEKEPSLVGISVNYLSQALTAFSMLGFIRLKFPRLKVIMGGGLITSWLKNSRWNNPFSGMVDHLVAGPGEYKLLALLGVKVTGKEMPRPDYHTLPRDHYLSPGFILPYSASSGCYWHKCSFCPEKAEGNPYIPIPPQQVMADLKALRETNAPVLIHFLDNAVSPALLDALSRESIGVPWYGFARIGPPLTDPDFCMALKQSGCVMLKLGIESGDQGVLDALEKGISVETASVVLENLKRAGIAAYVYLLFGTPAETEAAAKKTLAFTVKNSDRIDFLNIAVFNMPVCAENDPGIETREFYEGDLSLYTDFIHPHGWDRKRVRMFLEKEFRKHPAVSAILKNEPPLFTSNHAPFFVMGRSERGVKK